MKVCNEKRKQNIKRDYYGWRKCSKSHARRIDTDRSGNPRCGLQGWLSIIPACCSAFCCLKHWSRSFSLGVSPLLLPDTTVSFSPSAFFTAFICLTTPSLRQRKCRDIVLDAKAVYTAADLSPATASKEATTTFICSQYLRYLLSTCNEKEHT